MAPVDLRDPWERQEGETTAAFAAFCTYRDLGPRRGLRPAARKHYGEPGTASGKIRQFETWSSRHGWVARAMAWDDLQDREGRLAHLEEVREMRRRHAQLAAGMLQTAAARLAGGTVTRGGVQVQVTALDPNGLTPYSVARLAEAGARIERLARGEATELVESPGDASVRLGYEQDAIRELFTNRPELAATLAAASAALDPLPDEGPDSPLPGTE